VRILQHDVKAVRLEPRARLCQPREIAAGEEHRLGIQAGLLAVRFAGAALPSTGVWNRSKLVDQGSVRPAMRAENTSDLPSD